MEEHSVRLWTETSGIDHDNLEEMYRQSASDRQSSKKVVDVVRSREQIKIQGKVLTEKTGSCLVTLEAHSGSFLNLAGF